MSMGTATTTGIARALKKLAATGLVLVAAMGCGVAGAQAAGASVAGAPAAGAPVFPSRPVTLVVPYAAGGGTDAIARTLARGLSTLWQQPVVVENRVGADGWLGTQRVLTQPADGYTILIQLNSMLLWKWALPEANFDVTRDVRLVTKMQSSPMVAVVGGSAKADSLRAFIDECRTGARPCSYGTSTVSAELVGKQLMTLGGVTNAVGVPYKGTAPMMNDLLGGHIHMALISAALAVPFDADGRAKALALGSPARYPRLPKTPTFTETGYSVQGNTWYGLMVRQGTPDAAFNTIVEGVKKVSTQADVLAAIDSQGGVPVFNSPDEFGREIQQELQFITPLGDKYLARTGTKP